LGPSKGLQHKINTKSIGLVTTYLWPGNRTAYSERSKINKEVSKQANNLYSTRIYK